MGHIAARAILLLGDGAGDRPVAELDGLTPLEAQNTPALDEIAARGENGLLDPIGPGVAVGSDTGHLALLGYDPYKYYQGRGPFEARGIGLDVRQGDLAFRCNFATVDDDWVILDRRAGRIKEGTAELAASVNQAAECLSDYLHAGEGSRDLLELGPVHCVVKESVEHRAALVVRGRGLDPRVTDADPHAEGERVAEVRALAPEAERTAHIVNRWVRISYETLRDHHINRERIARGLPPANIILPRGVGVAPHLKPFAEEHGVSGAMIVEVGLIQGMGQYLDMDVLQVPGATGGADTDEIALARAVVEAVQDHDFVLCNLKAPDLAGHDGNARAKMVALDKLDRLARHLLDNLDLSQTVIMVAADHSTPVSVKDHTGDAVALALAGYGVRPDEVTSYGERPCARGSLHRVRGADVMPILRNLIGAQEKFGA
jgi:2,3-bisphosphoglycerate-independent phosphoglycerate mutase